MAPSSAGWLKPDDLSERAVVGRALELLGDFLDDDQREQVERFHGFAIVERDRAYWIPLEGTPWCAFADDGHVEHYCIAPDEPGAMPGADISLTYLLWIRFDRAAFHQEANVLGTKTIEWPDRESQLVEMLAEVAGPRRVRPTRRRRTRSTTRAGGAASGATCLSEAQLRDLFARHGRDVTDDVVKKLARRLR